MLYVLLHPQTYLLIFFFKITKKHHFFEQENRELSQKLIEFLVHFYDCSYNIIACFYAEICTIYQISIFQNLLTDMKIPAKIRSENSSKAR